jgi:hypothetical protein
MFSGVFNIFSSVLCSIMNGDMTSHSAFAAYNTANINCAGTILHSCTRQAFAGLLNARPLNQMTLLCTFSLHCEDTLSTSHHALYSYLQYFQYSCYFHFSTESFQIYETLMMPCMGFTALEIFCCTLNINYLSSFIGCRKSKPNE